MSGRFLSFQFSARSNVGLRSRGHGFAGQCHHPGFLSDPTLVPCHLLLFLGDLPSDSEQMPLACSVWAVKLPDPAERDAAYRSLQAVANEHDVARADRFKQPDDRLRSLLSRLLPHAILTNAPFDLPAEKVVIETEAKGRPYFVPEGDSDLVFDFNCTHDHDYVCCGFLSGPFTAENASSRIGTDVMKLANPFPDCSTSEMLDMLRDQLDPAEVAAVEALSGDKGLELMLRYWAHKEALVKATGEGVGAGLERYRMDFGEPTKVYEDGIAATAWRLFERQLENDHLLVIALHLPGFTTGLPQLEPQILTFSVHDIVTKLSTLHNV